MAAVCVASCDEAPTMIIARIESDLRPCEELRSINLRAQWENGGTLGDITVPNGTMDACRTPLYPPGEIRLVPRDPADARKVAIVVTGSARAADGSPYTLRQEFVTNFQRGRVLYVAFSLARVCANSTCPTGYSCVPGPSGTARCASPDEAIVFPQEQVDQRDASVWTDTRSEVFAADGGQDAAVDQQPPTSDADVPAMDNAPPGDAGDEMPDVIATLDAMDAVEPEVSIDVAGAVDAPDADDAPPSGDTLDSGDTSDSNDTSSVADTTDTVDVLDANDSGDGRDDVESDLSCPTGQTRCSSTCRDLNSDPLHCSRCDNACPSGTRCLSGVCGYPRSCAEYRRLDPTLVSGVYRIDLDGIGARPPLDVYCDMAMEGGGWTLVARVRGDSAAHHDIAAVGALVSPMQAVPAKLSDADINVLRGDYARSLVRFDCLSQRTYFQDTRAFRAIGGSDEALLRCSGSPDGPWSTAEPMHFTVPRRADSRTGSPLFVEQARG